MPAAHKTIVCCNLSPVMAKVAVNRRRMLEFAGQLADAKIAPDVVVFPELALTGYLLESLVAECAMSADEVTDFARELAASGLSAETEFVIGLPLAERGEIFNAAVVLKCGAVKHIHRKLFLPTYGMFDEARYFHRGTVFTAYEGALGKTVVLICEDAWHVELAYAASIAEADAVIVISASPARGETDANAFASTLRWRGRLQTFSESYGQVYVYCNRGGTEDGVLFDASSFVLDHEANFVESKKAGTEATLYELGERSTRHAGFSGNSARQNDRALILKILSEI